MCDPNRVVRSKRNDCCDLDREPLNLEIEKLKKIVLPMKVARVQHRPKKRVDHGVSIGSPQCVRWESLAKVFS